MTKLERDKFRKILKTKQAELEQSETSARMALEIEPTADELDRMQYLQERDFAMGLLDRNAKLLREVHVALGRLDAGTFGICLECDEVIGMKRLAAVPWTSSCITCQEAAESGADQPGRGAEQLVSAD